MSTFNIYSLSDKPEFVKTCASWSFTEWGCQIPNSSLEKVVDGYTERSKNSKQFPYTWICVSEDNKPAGMASLKIDDHPDHKDIFPWLASVFVHPAFRGHGLSHVLIEQVEKEAKNLGYSKVYLFTHTAEGLYEKCGWIKIGEVADPMGIRTTPDTLMSKDL